MLVCAEQHARGRNRHVIAPCGLFTRRELHHETTEPYCRRACLVAICAHAGAKEFRSSGYVMRTIWPFYGALIVALMIVTYVPAFSLWLPQMSGYLPK